MTGPRDRLEDALQPRGDGATLAVEQGMAEEEAEREREELEDELDQGVESVTSWREDLEREGLSRDDLEQLALEDEVAVDEDSDQAAEAVMRDLGLDPFGDLD